MYPSHSDQLWTPARCSECCSADSPSGQRRPPAQPRQAAAPPGTCSTACAPIPPADVSLSFRLIFDPGDCSAGRPSGRRRPPARLRQAAASQGTRSTTCAPSPPAVVDSDFRPDLQHGESQGDPRQERALPCAAYGPSSFADGGALNSGQTIQLKDLKLVDRKVQTETCTH